MKKKEALIRALPAIALVIGFISMIGVQASNRNPKATAASRPFPHQAYTIPVSETRVTLLIGVDDRKPVKVTQLDGGLIRIEKVGSAIFGFTPYVKNRETREIGMKAFQITEIRDGKSVIGERITEIGNIETTSLNTGSAAVWEHNDSQFTFDVRNVTLGDVIDYGNLKPETLSAHIFSTSTCCIICDGVRICACAVDASCGACCAGSCCDGMILNSLPPSK